MRFLISEKLGPHKYKTPEGYLVCVDAILSRTGTQEYRRSELFGDACDDPDKIVTVDRKEDEVFSDKTMASFENKAICIEHPNANVNVENHNDLSVGFVRDIRRGEDNGTPVMMGTLVITNKEAVEAVESGEYKELSCGYDCDIEDEHSPQQRNIRGNHVALCKQGRAGIARIVDSIAQNDTLKYEKLKREREELEEEIDRNDNNAYYNLRETHKRLEQIDKEMEKLRKNSNSLNDAKLPAKDRNIISSYLHSLSKYTKNDPDIIDLISPLKRKGYEIFRKNIKGWYKISDGRMRKDYFFGVNGYDNTFMISVYADNEEWKVNEVNAYFTDSANILSNKEKEMKDELLTDMDVVDASSIQIPKSSKEFERVIRAYYKNFGKIIQVETMVYDFESGKYYMYNESTDYSFTSKRLSDSLTEDAVINDALDLAGFVAKHKEISVIRKYVNGWLVNIPPKDVDRFRYLALKKGIYLVKSRKFPGKYVLKGWDGSYEYYIDSIEDDTFTVEYVKDNITHIVEVEATSLEDAILKAKDEIKDISIARLNKREDKLARLLGKITDYVKTNGPLTLKELATHFNMSTSDMYSHLSQLCTNIGGVKQIRVGQEFKYIGDSFLKVKDMNADKENKELKRRLEIAYKRFEEMESRKERFLEKYRKTRDKLYLELANDEQRQMNKLMDAILKAEAKLRKL